MTCKHENFQVSADVFRLSQEDGGPITHYNAEIRIACADCGALFRPVGLPIGLSPYRPATNLAGETLNLPIMPPGEVAPPGLPSYFVDLAAITS